jgi:general L-amino acid transport system substrate-binding protein
MKSFVLALSMLAVCQAHAAGRLRCGVITEPLDWNKTDLHGSLAALDVEICRAIAIARYGAPDRLDIQTYASEEEGLMAVHADKSDIVAGVTPDTSAGQKYALRFSIPFFYDGQGFMVHRAEGIHALADITGHKLCYIEDTDNDAVVLNALAARGIKPVRFGFQEEGEMDAAIMDRHCQVTSAFVSKLAEARASFHNHQDYVLLPELLTLAPVTVAMDGRDGHLAGIVDMTLSALLQAEFLGVTAASAPHVPQSGDPRLQRLLGDDYATAAALDLPHDWSRHVIEAVGNYAEIYARTVGPGTPLDLPRGLNALWNQGGIMAPLPLH